VQVFSFVYSEFGASSMNFGATCSKSCLFNARGGGGGFSGGFWHQCRENKLPAHPLCLSSGCFLY